MNAKPRKVVARETRPTKIERWAIEIMNFEGYFKGSVSYRNRNPGNLKTPGRPTDTSGHAIFPTFEIGWDALVHQLTIALDGRSKVYKPGMTILEFFTKYAEGNSRQYANFIAKRFDVEITDKIGDVFG